MGDWGEVGGGAGGVQNGKGKRDRAPAYTHNSRRMREVQEYGVACCLFQVLCWNNGISRKDWEKKEGSPKK